MGRVVMGRKDGGEMEGLFVSGHAHDDDDES